MHPSSSCHAGGSSALVRIGSSDRQPCIVCLQETKVPYTAGVERYLVYHSLLIGQVQGSGVATFVPKGLHVVSSDLGPWHVHVYIRLSSGARLHIVNLYLPA